MQPHSIGLSPQKRVISMTLLLCIKMASFVGSRSAGHGGIPVHELFGRVFFVYLAVACPVAAAVFLLAWFGQ